TGAISARASSPPWGRSWLRWVLGVIGQASWLRMSDPRGSVVMSPRVVRQAPEAKPVFVLFLACRAAPGLQTHTDSIEQEFGYVYADRSGPALPAARGRARIALRSQGCSPRGHSSGAHRADPGGLPAGPAGGPGRPADRSE